MAATHRISSTPYLLADEVLADERYQWMGNHSLIDSPAFRFRSQSEDAQASQCIGMAQYEIISLYRNLIRWFAGPDAQLFYLCSWETTGTNWGWGSGSRSHQRQFDKWVPKDASGIQKVADIVAGGSYDIKEMAQLKREQGYDSSVLSDKVYDIYRIYDAAAWYYSGSSFPSAPCYFANWRRNLAWFAKCRDMIDVEPMLDAYAQGVPADYIVADDISELRAQLKANGGSQKSRFPHFTESQPFQTRLGFGRLFGG